MTKFLTEIQHCRKFKFVTLREANVRKKFAIQIRYGALEVSPSKERCAMCEFLGQLSSSYVVNLMIFWPFLL